VTGLPGLPGSGCPGSHQVQARSARTRRGPPQRCAAAWRGRQWASTSRQQGRSRVPAPRCAGHRPGCTRLRQQRVEGRKSPSQRCCRLPHGRHESECSPARSGPLTAWPPGCQNPGRCLCRRSQHRRRAVPTGGATFIQPGFLVLPRRSGASYQPYGGHPGFSIDVGGQQHDPPGGQPGPGTNRLTSQHPAADALRVIPHQRPPGRAVKEPAQECPHAATLEALVSREH